MIDVIRDSIPGVFSRFKAVALATLGRACSANNLAIITQAARAFWPENPFVTFLPAPNVLTVDATILEWSRATVVWIEGSEDLAQLLYQILNTGTVALQPFPGEVSVCYTALFDELLGRIGPRVLPDSTRPLMLAGHSAGGAMALLMAHWMRLNIPHRFKCVVTFAMPKIGTRQFVEGLHFPHLRIANIGDVVPYLPPPRGGLWNPLTHTIFRSFNHHHHGNLTVLDDHGLLYGTSHNTEWFEMYQGTGMNLNELTLTDQPEHSLREYSRRCLIGVRRHPYDAQYDSLYEALTQLDRL